MNMDIVSLVPLLFFNILIRGISDISMDSNLYKVLCKTSMGKKRKYKPPSPLGEPRLANAIWT